MYLPLQWYIVNSSYPPERFLHVFSQIGPERILMSLRFYFRVLLYSKYIVFNSRFIVNMPSRVHQRIINLSQSTNPFGFCDSFCDNAAFATHPGDADVDHLQSGYLT